MYDFYRNYHSVIYNSVKYGKCYIIFIPRKNCTDHFFQGTRTIAFVQVQALAMTYLVNPVMTIILQIKGFLGGIAYSMLCQEKITSLLLRNKNNYISYVISYSPNCFHIQLPVRMRATICCDYVQSRNQVS